MVVRASSLAWKANRLVRKVSSAYIIAEATAICLCSSACRASASFAARAVSTAATTTGAGGERTPGTEVFPRGNVRDWAGPCPAGGCVLSCGGTFVAAWRPGAGRCGGLATARRRALVLTGPDAFLATAGGFGCCPRPVLILVVAGPPFVGGARDPCRVCCDADAGGGSLGETRLSRNSSVST